MILVYWYPYLIVSMHLFLSNTHTCIIHSIPGYFCLYFIFCSCFTCCFVFCCPRQEVTKNSYSHRKAQHLTYHWFCFWGLFEFSKNVRGNIVLFTPLHLSNNLDLLFADSHFTLKRYELKSLLLSNLLN